MQSIGTIEAGRPYPFGATVDAGGVNFALFSGHATKVELCLFDETGGREIVRIALPERTVDVWHGYLPGAKPGLKYGYRVYGPYAPTEGHRFNPNKLLIDPYARVLDRTFVWNEIHCGYVFGSDAADLSFDIRDNAALMPKCLVSAPLPPSGAARPYTKMAESVIYEMHIRGFTMRHPMVPKELRGTAGALRHPEVLSYVRDLGVTAVELLPVNPIANTAALAKLGLRDYWGYNSINYFAVEPRYLFEGAREDFHATVDAFHDAGIEVILDIVFNHTGEGSVLGPTLSYRGIDNASYYALAGNKRIYRDDTGCGHSLNFDHPKVRQMAMDAMRYWVGEMGVDGFRFDLAVTNARVRGEFSPDAPLLACIRQDPVLSQVKMIAEPWDLGFGGYRLGGFPRGWGEWNDRYRDDVRKFWRGDGGMLGLFASRLAGSSDMFGGRGPCDSVNFVTAHDGFTLADLVGYNSKHNEANGEDNRDGTGENCSFNCGAEGPSNDPHINSLRLRRRRNLIATLLLSQGVPMLTAGDEIGRSQGGNNNAYCQDNEISWLDWSTLVEEGDFLRFVQALVRLRKDHPTFRRTAFFTGSKVGPGGLKDIVWLNQEGREMTEADWRDAQRHTFGARLDGGAGGESFLLLLNASSYPQPFVLPAFAGVRGFSLAFDTADANVRPQVYAADAVYPLSSNALVLFAER
jgi:isoamylase